MANKKDETPPTLDLLKNGMAQAIDFQIGQILEGAFSETVLRKMVMEEVARQVRETVKEEIVENRHGWLSRGVRQIVEAQITKKLADGKLTEKLDAALTARFNEIHLKAGQMNFEAVVRNAVESKMYNSYGLEQKAQGMVEQKIGTKLEELLGDATSEWANTAIGKFVAAHMAKKGT
jgi:hypothetical protein